MLRLIFFIFLTLILYSLLRFLFKGMSSSGKKRDRKQDPEELVQDPYCQTYIPKQSALKKKIAGEVLYFCNQECLKNYVQKATKSD
jgi:YHS domain-containing protein